MSIIKLKTREKPQNPKRVREVIASSEKQHLNCWMDRKLLQRFKLTAISNGRRMSDLITEWVINYVKNNEKK